jgi:putative PIN family toxin of toxin-antitoxin system
MDTNVTVSAIVFGGKPRQVLDSAFRGSTRLCVSEATVKEIRDVLLRPRFCLTPDKVESIVSDLVSIADWAEPKEHVRVITEDPDDNIFLECALASASGCIVSGDQQLLDLENWHGIRILSPDRYLEDFLGRNPGRNVL